MFLRVGLEKRFVVRRDGRQLGLEALPFLPTFPANKWPKADQNTAGVCDTEGSAFRVETPAAAEHAGDRAKVQAVVVGGGVK